MTHSIGIADEESKKIIQSLFQVKETFIIKFIRC